MGAEIIFNCGLIVGLTLLKFTPVVGLSHWRSLYDAIEWTSTDTKDASCKIKLIAMKCVF